MEWRPGSARATQNGRGWRRLLRPRPPENVEEGSRGRFFLRTRALATPAPGHEPPRGRAAPSPSARAAPQPVSGRFALQGGRHRRLRQAAANRGLTPLTGIPRPELLSSTSRCTPETLLGRPPASHRQAVGPTRAPELVLFLLCARPTARDERPQAEQKHPPLPGPNPPITFPP